jgi:hypothetical protein
MMLAHALNLSSRGFRVIPLRVGGKLPAIKEWQVKATTDRATIEKLWGRRLYNVGIYAGEHVVDGEPRHIAVLDLDRKNGADGVTELEKLAAPHGGLPDTWTTETPTGGRHLWFYTSRSVGSNAGVIAPGVDVRGVGGFVVAPGSTIDSAEYRVGKDVPIAQCPPWLEGLLPSPGAPRAKAANREPLPGIDPERAAKRAIEYLTTQAPEAIEGAGGDHTTFVVAAKLKDLGVDPATAVELMLEHWFDGCGWSSDELAVKVRNAYTYGANPPGTDAPEAQFSAVPAATPDAEPHAKDSQFKPLRIADLRGLPWPEWAVRNVIPSAGVGLIYGPSKSGKTFLGLDIACACVRGIPWAGLPTRKGAVVYVGLEGQARTRALAYATKHGLADHELADLIIFEQPPLNMLDPSTRDSSVSSLVRVVQKTAPQQRVVLTIIDTLAQATPGGDENSSVMMGAAIANAKRIARELGGTVVLVHHAGKQEGAGARGHSSLTAAADFEIAVSRPNDGQLRFAKVTKVKDAEDGAQWSFELEPVTLGWGPSVPGCAPELRSSCVVSSLTPLQPGQARAKQKALTPLQQAVVRALSVACESQQLDWEGRGTCSLKQWRGAYEERTPLDDDPARGGLEGAKERRRKNFDAAKKRLVELGLVEQLIEGEGLAAYKQKTAPG